MWTLCAQLCIIGIWQSWGLRKYNEMTYVTMKLDYVFKKFNIILGSIVNKIGRVYMNIKGEVKPSL